MLQLGPGDIDVSSLRSAFAASGVPLAVLPVPDEAARELYGCDLALIRPDHHVAWRGNAVPEAPQALAALVSGHTQ